MAWPKLVFALLALGVALLAAACSLSGLRSLPELPKPVAATFTPAVRDQVQKAYDDARQHPRDAAACGRLGMVLHAYEQYQSAAVCYRRASLLEPGSFRWIYYLGLAQSGAGDSADAAATLYEAVRIEPGYLPAKLRLADALRVTGDSAGGRKIYEALIIVHPGLAAAYYGLGQIESAQGDASSAIAHYRKACELFENFGAAHYALALAYRRNGDASRAERHFNAYEKHKLDRPPIEDSLLSAISELKESGVDYLRRAANLEAAGKLPEAIQALERALEVDPQLVQAHTGLISLYGRANQPQRAEEHYRAGLKSNPDQAELHYNFGVLETDQNRYAEAVKAFEKAIAINPEYADAHHNLGFLLERERRFDDAMREYRLAINSEQDFRLARYHLGRLLLARGRSREAVDQFLKTLTPEDDKTPTYMFGLAAAYNQAGNRERAIFYGREAQKRAAGLGQTELAATMDLDLQNLQRAGSAR